ncbi:MAG: histidine kinase [Notoacmeibacter sp.]|nr:histidine kinase [Notoacmeibacter sp.]MCB2004729.1 hypothetical protein [Rhodoferax sp.]
MRLVPRSLALRVVGFSTVWAVIALVVIATVITSLYNTASIRAFERILAANLFNLIGAVGLSADGNLEGTPEFGDIRFSEPDSGWYWAVEPIGNSKLQRMASPSMTARVEAPDVTAVPFNPEFQRSYVAKGTAGEMVRVVESEYILGASGDAVRFRLMGNETELQRELAYFRDRLWTYLALFGAGMIGINAVAIRLGLLPLDRVRTALEDIREGRIQKLEGDFPHEIAPLTDEMNAMIENNRRIIERSRTQVGNLAHSLKTPLAVMLNEGRATAGGKGRIITEQAEAMRNQVEHYLQRARIAAQRDSVVFRVDATPVMERMVRVMAKLNADKRVSFSHDEGKLIFAGEQQDLEEIAGNLLENAMKWSRGQVKVSLAKQGREKLRLVIADDGPGIPAEQASLALKRGKRLDEKVPGTGLGLSIVSELVGEYGGELVLGRSDLGGLEVRIDLPRAHA